MPSSAIECQVDIYVNTENEMSIISLKSWFTRDDDFWKQSKPFVPKETNDSNVEEVTELIEDVIKESNIEELEIGDSRIPTPNEENKEEELPF